jgi:hypothetical protein
MAEPYDVLASLNRMLESEERREQYKLQSSLSLMQFAQQKRLQDIQLAGQQLELLQAANSQMMGSQSQSFLTDSGLDGLYLSTFDEDKPENSAADMVKELKRGDWKFSDAEANRVVGAVYASKAGQHSGILKIGSDLNSAIQLGDMSSDAQKSLFNKFKSGYPSLSPDTLSSMGKTASNQAQIVQEMFEFGQGEYDISPDIGMQDLLESPDEEIKEALIKISDEGSQIGQQETKSMMTESSFKEEVGNYEKQIEELTSEIQGQYQDISNLENQKRMIDAKEFSGIPLSQKEQDFSERTREIRALGEAEIQNLNSQIKDLKEEQSKYKIAQFTSKPIPGTQLKKGTLLDDEEYFIEGVGGMSGRLY